MYFTKFDVILKTSWDKQDKNHCIMGFLGSQKHADFAILKKVSWNRDLVVKHLMYIKAMLIIG